MKQKSEIEEGFASATTLEEIFKAFKDMASAFAQDDFFLDFLKANRLERLQESKHQTDLYERLLEFGKKALEMLENGNKAPLPVAMTLHVMGTASFNLQRFNESLGYLERAHTKLTKLEEEGVNVDNVRSVFYALLQELMKTNTAMGRREEAIRNNIKILELLEKDLGQESREVGIRNRKVAVIYVIIMKFKDALPFCLKAIKIHTGQEENNSLEIAYDRRLLGVIYTGLEEHDKAREQTEMYSKILEDHPNHLTVDKVDEELNVALAHIEVRKYDEALNILQNVLQLENIAHETKALVLIIMAKAYCQQQNFLGSKRCLDKARINLEWEGSASMATVNAYMHSSMIYEVMNEFEAAMLPLERCLTILEKIPLSPSQISIWKVSVRIGWLLVLTKKASESIIHLISASEILRQCFGPKYIELGYVYNNMGAAYLELGKTKEAKKSFEDARDIIVASLGTHHVHSIIARQNLSKVRMRSLLYCYKSYRWINFLWPDHGQPLIAGLGDTDGLDDEVREATGGFRGVSLIQRAYADDDDDEITKAQRALGQLSLDRVPATTPTKAVLLPPIISEIAGFRNPRDRIDY